jgi:hypothetical protein
MLVRCDFDGDTPEAQTEEMRKARNGFLAWCDWTVLPDAPTDKQAWETYRQQLRDLPATWTPSPTAEFPDPPGA